MNYLSYQHIQKFGNSEVEGINQGTCYLTYKIDGTNGCVYLSNDGKSLSFGSRRRVLSADTKDADNQDFVKLMTSPEYKEVHDELLEFLQKYPACIIYGEWLVPSTLRTYKNDSWKNFYVFDIYNTVSDLYWNYDDYSKLFDEEYPHIKYIPLLAKLENPTEEELRACLDKTGDWLVKSGLGEGIVIKNYNYRNRFGRRVWAKMLTEDYKQIKHDNRTHNHEMKESDNKTEYEIISMMTVEHILKEKQKVIEAHNCPGFENSLICETINRAYDEFIKDNIEIIVLKKFRGKTINFKVLKQLSDAKVREIILK